MSSKQPRLKQPTNPEYVFSIVKGSRSGEMYLDLCDGKRGAILSYFLSTKEIYHTQGGTIKVPMDVLAEYTAWCLEVAKILEESMDIEGVLENAV